MKSGRFRRLGFAAIAAAVGCAGLIGCADSDPYDVQKPVIEDGDADNQDGVEEEVDEAVDGFTADDQRMDE